jgi:hypothetical protein
MYKYNVSVYSCEQKDHKVSQDNVTADQKFRRHLAYHKQLYISAHLPPRQSRVLIVPPK